jgi:hypothetical protein
VGIASTPTVNGNTFDSPLATALVSIVYLGTSATSPVPPSYPIDLRYNYWGTDDPAQIVSRMSADRPNETIADLSGYLDAAGQPPPPSNTNLLGFPRNWTFLAIDTSGPGKEFKPTSGSQASIQYTMWEDATVELFVYTTDDTTLTFDPGSPATQLVRTLVDSDPSDGDDGHRTASETPYIEQWDGRDDSGQLVPEGIYVLLGSVTPDSTGTPVSSWAPKPRVRPEFPINGTSSVSHNIYRNRNVRVRLDLPQDGSALSYPSRLVITAAVGPATDVSPIADRLFFLKGEDGTRDIYLDLRDVDTGDIDPTWEAGATIGTWATDPIEYLNNAVLVRDTAPTLSGPDQEVDSGVSGAAENVDWPAIEVKADPYFLHWSYDQTATLRYCLSNVPAEVTAYVLRGGFGDVLNPGAVKIADFYDPHAPVTTALIDATPTPVPGATWCPTEGDVGYEAVLLIDTADPPNPGNTLHSFVLEASLPGEQSAKAVARGVIQIAE